MSQSEPVQKPDEKIPDISVTRSVICKGRMAKKGHAYFTAKGINKKGETCIMTEMHKTEGLFDISELAIKGRLVNRFRQHFKI